MHWLITDLLLTNTSRSSVDENIHILVHLLINFILQSRSIPMNINNFIFVGRISSLRTIANDHLRIVLAEVGPKKVSASADIRDRELVGILTKPGGFGVGDTVSLQGMCVLDPATGMNVALVHKTGASRIALAPAAAASGPAVSTKAGSFPTEYTTRPRVQPSAPVAPVPAAQEQVVAPNAPSDGRWPSTGHGYDDDIPFGPAAPRAACFSV